MKFELKMDKETMATIGKGAGKIGKTIVIEGTKAVVLKGANAVIVQSFDGGLGSVNELNLDDILRGGKKKESKNGLFSFKKKTKGDGDNLETEVDITFAEDAEVTIDESEDVLNVKPADKPKNIKKAK